MLGMLCQTDLCVCVCVCACVRMHARMVVIHQESMSIINLPEL
jgi:hypothetical protein